MMNLPNYTIIFDIGTNSKAKNKKRSFKYIKKKKSVVRKKRPRFIIKE